MDEIVALTHVVLVDRAMRRRLARGMTRWRHTRPKYWRSVAVRVSTCTVMVGGAMLLFTRLWWVAVPLGLVAGALMCPWVLWTDHRALERRQLRAGDATVRIGIGATCVRVAAGDQDLTTGYGYYRALHLFGDVVVFETRPPSVGVTASPRELFSDAELAHMRASIMGAGPG